MVRRAHCPRGEEREGGPCDLPVASDAIDRGSQARKFVGTPDEEEVRQAKSPMVAARIGRSRQRPLRKDWETVKDAIMHEARSHANPKRKRGLPWTQR